GEHDTITVTIDTTGLSDGSYQDTVSISSDGGSGSVTIKITVYTPPNPILSYSPTTIDFGTKSPGETDSDTFDIWNSGTGTLSWSVSESCSWITGLSPSSGSSTGEHDTVTVSIDTTGLSDGNYQNTVSISSDGGSGSVTIKVTVYTPPNPILSYSPTTINFGTKSPGETDSATFSIWNSGTGTLSWSVSESCSWITGLSPSSGSSTGEHDTVTVSIDTEGLTGYHEATITITSNGGSGSIKVSVNSRLPMSSYSLLGKKCDPITRTTIKGALDYIVRYYGNYFLETVIDNTIINLNFKINTGDYSFASGFGIELEFEIDVSAEYKSSLDKIIFTISPKSSAKIDSSQLNLLYPFSIISDFVMNLISSGVDVSFGIEAGGTLEFEFNTITSQSSINSVDLYLVPKIEIEGNYLIALINTIEPGAGTVIEHINGLAKHFDIDINDYCNGEIIFKLNLLLGYSKTDGYYGSIGLTTTFNALEIKNIITIGIEGNINVEWSQKSGWSKCGHISLFITIDVWDTILNWFDLEGSYEKNLYLGSCHSMYVQKSTIHITSDEFNNDTDNDYLPDDLENLLGTNSTKNDTDNDGLWDYIEVLYGLNPKSNDSDNDNLTDFQEFIMFYTNWSSIDSDNDSLSDYSEITLYMSNPNSIDTDLDFIADNLEVLIYNTLVNDSDSDNDFILDGLEIFWYNTSAVNATDIPKDKNNNGIYDADESIVQFLANLYQSKPSNSWLIILIVCLVSIAAITPVAIFLTRKYYPRENQKLKVVNKIPPDKSAKKVKEIPYSIYNTIQDTENYLKNPQNRVKLIKEKWIELHNLLTDQFQLKKGITISEIKENVGVKSFLNLNKLDKIFDKITNLYEKYIYQEQHKVPTISETITFNTEIELLIKQISSKLKDQ
ncbi:MAG: Ig-like domain-containing protein, partial [Candidatus Helarchaeota archaeon]